MKVEKWAIWGKSALAHACKAMGIRPISMSQFALLCVVKRYGTTTAATMHRYGSYSLAMEKDRIRAIRVLSDLGLLTRSSKGVYAITPEGREFCSIVRRYMLHKRF